MKMVEERGGDDINYRNPTKMKDFSLGRRQLPFPLGRNIQKWGKLGTGGGGMIPPRSRSCRSCLVAFPLPLTPLDHPSINYSFIQSAVDDGRKSSPLA